jgi:hypothetical protein
MCDSFIIFLYEYPIQNKSMDKHVSFAIMAAVLLTAVATIALYTVNRVNAQGNETSAAGGEEHNVTNAAGGEEHNVTNAAGGEEHNVTNAAGNTTMLANVTNADNITHVEVAPATHSRQG